jgi:radical SAM superfamily enzyme
MKNILFIEFYYILPNNSIMVLNNGFSPCYNLCNNIISIEIRLDDLDYTLNLLRKALTLEKFDMVYVSSFYLWHTIFVYKIASEFPNINFIVGGPDASSSKVNTKLLFEQDNFKLTSEPLRSIFPEIYHERKWGLNFPKLESNIKNIEFSMCNSRRTCSWGKCKFCTSNSKFPRINSGDDPIINFIENIPTELRETKQLLIHTQFPDITFKELRELTPIFNYDIRINYCSALRAVKIDRLKKFKDVLVEILNPNRISFQIGIEFLSNRMLEYMNKGLTVDDYVGTITLLQELNFSINLNIILGWNNLTFNDVKEFNNALEKFDSSKVRIVLGRFYATNETKPYFEKDIIECEEEDRGKLIFNRYYFKLSDKKQISFNNLIEKICKNKFEVLNYNNNILLSKAVLCIDKLYKDANLTFKT